ncbi:MAG: four helix bundle protein [Bacteroidota bacterium]|nr:four helix bundle protein [Bacteroidota bacterium]
MMQLTELDVWKAGIELSKKCFEISQKFPEIETDGLGSQLKKVVIGIPANVSAAASRKHGKESLRHLFRARDMIYEVESHLYLANALGYITNEELEEMLETLNTSKRLLFGFIKHYKRTSYPRRQDQNYNQNRNHNLHHNNSDHHESFGDDGSDDDL